MDKSKKSSRNIPKQIRGTIQARYDKKERLLKAAEKASGLYEKAETEEFRTRKGKWTVYKEHDYRAPMFVEPTNDDRCDRFCAVYSREGRPRTIVRGTTADEPVIHKTLQGISKKIIEQRPLVSRPARSLTEENGLSYGIRTGLIFAVLLGLFILFDYVLIPNYPMAFLQAANITQGKEVSGYSPDAKIFQYQSLTGRFVGRLFPAKYKELSTSMYTLIAAFIIPILIFGIVYESAGKGADRRRMKYLPKEAASFKYGLEAVEAILAEDILIIHEKTKAELYSRLSSYGLSMGKIEFEKVYDELIISDS